MRSINQLNYKVPEKSHSTEKLVVYIKSVEKVVGLDKRKKPASITMTPKPRNVFTATYECGPIYNDEPSPVTWCQQQCSPGEPPHSRRLESRQRQLKLNKGQQPCPHGVHHVD